MIKSFSALAMSAFLGVSAIALPGFAPAASAQEAVVSTKPDRLPVAENCASQTWPNIASACLRDAGSGAAVHEARLVTVRR